MKVSSIRKSFLSTLVLFSLLSMSSTSVHADVSSGANCMPATLGQALALGFTTNQFGVSNPGTNNFFVVCPLDVQIGGPYNEVGIGANFDAPGTIDCIIRLASGSNASLNAVPATINNTGTGYASSFTTVTTDAFIQVNHTIVCALAPGERINWYAIYNF